MQVHVIIPSYSIVYKCDLNTLQRLWINHNKMLQDYDCHGSCLHKYCTSRIIHPGIGQFQ